MLTFLNPNQNIFERYLERLREKSLNKELTSSAKYKNTKNGGGNVELKHSVIFYKDKYHYLNRVPVPEKAQRVRQLALKKNERIRDQNR